MFDTFLEKVEFVMFMFIPFSIIMWIKGIIWLKYHLHYNVKVRQTTTTAKVRNVFKWNFVRPYVIWLIIIPITCLISGQVGEFLMMAHIFIMAYIRFIRHSA